VQWFRVQSSALGSVSEINSSNDSMFEMRDHGTAYVSTFSSSELFPVFHAEDKIVVLSSKYLPILQLRTRGLLCVIFRGANGYACHDSWVAKLAQYV